MTPKFEIGQKVRVIASYSGFKGIIVTILEIGFTGERTVYRVEPTYLIFAEHELEAVEH
jgi:hypothetical protein